MAQVALDLDDGQAGLDVDAPPAADLRFELDVDEVVFAQVQAAIEEDRLDVSLDVGLSSHRAAGELAREDCEINDCGHQSEL